MSIDPCRTPLMLYLKSANVVYYAKICELRTAIQSWLEYIPQTFPHYTRHTIQHSDEIMLQLSKLLFRNEDPDQPMIRFSAIETYILAAAAYLHDVGMVTSDKEKIEIIGSPEWKSWTSGEGGGARRWSEIRGLRTNRRVADEIIRHFLADMQTRFLIAEFVRRGHHLRSGDLITLHSEAFGQFAFGDPILLRTIRNVCVAHGMTQDQLRNHLLYPERCDIQGQKANVLFIAILLRIGDLLDMSSDRACPLLLNAACPLPSDSLAHWTKYQRIESRLTAPDRIEITAKCHTQEEHRLLQDWCQWLVSEIHEAGILMSHASRHDDWRTPLINIDGDEPTIVIGPAESATYIPSRWVFIMDQKLAFRRLVNDAYRSEYDFVLELIQNGLDANRCQMYIDLDRAGLSQPDYPTHVDEDRRRTYPLKISLKKKRIRNEMSGEMEDHQVLTVEDCGIGMDKDIIEHYLLQVGHSYYRSDEFRRSFTFIPSSHFGVGFLSVFAVSDNTVVETYKPTSRNEDGPIRLTLTGPQNYLLMEHGKRQSSGTTIEVLLRKPLDKEELAKRIVDWCRRVEFPVILDVGKVVETVTAELPEQFTYEIPIITEKDARFAMKSFPISANGVEGELYIFSIVDSQGDSWDSVNYAFEYPGKHLQAVAPPIMSNCICVNGIKVPDDSLSILDALFSPIRCRVDVRNKAYFTRKHRWPFVIDEVFDERLVRDILPSLEDLLRKHLSDAPRANSSDSWKYKQRLWALVPLRDFWQHVPGAIRIYVRGKPRLVSLEEIENFPIMTTTLDLTDSSIHLVHSYHYNGILHVNEVPSWDNDLPTITDGDIQPLSRWCMKGIFDKRRIRLVRWLKSKHLAVDWELGEREILFPRFYNKLLQSRDQYVAGVPFPGALRFELTSLPDNQTIGFYLHNTDTDWEHLTLNRNCSFVKWLMRLSGTQENKTSMKEKELHYIMQSLHDSIRYHHNDEFVKKLNECLSLLRELPEIPTDLRAPIWNLNQGMFRLGFPKA